jgi:hypothetical protein
VATETLPDGAQQRSGAEYVALGESMDVMIDAGKESDADAQTVVAPGSSVGSLPDSETAATDAEADATAAIQAAEAEAIQAAADAEKAKNKAAYDTWLAETLELQRRRNAHTADWRQQNKERWAARTPEEVAAEEAVIAAMEVTQAAEAVEAARTKAYMDPFSALVQVDRVPDEDAIDEERAQNWARSAARRLATMDNVRVLLSLLDSE